VVRRGFDGPVEGGFSACDSVDDFVGGASPDEGFGTIIPVVDPPVEPVTEFGHRFEAGVGERFALSSSWESLRSSASSMPTTPALPQPIVSGRSSRAPEMFVM